MKKKITLKTKNQIYSVYIEPGSTLKNLEYFNRIKSKKIFLIDRKVFYIFKKLKNYKLTNHIVIDCSEKIKNFKNYSILCEKILSFGIDRDTKIIAIGGGTLGDLSGFVAGTILRGLELILFPTTLLSQVDSSIGGKNGINTTNGKNLIGTFHQPKFVFIDPKLLHSLPKRQMLSGYAEIIKHAIINDRKLFNWLDKNSHKLFNLDIKILCQAIYKSISIKKKYINKDEKEKLSNKNSRAILNFGHTFGHALETYYNYNKKLTHGEAISIGMIIAATISNKLKFLSVNELNKIKKHFIFNKLPINDIKMNDNKIFEIIKNDKKNKQGKINFILINEIGNAFLKKKVNLEKIKKILN